jgi:hypothetical protein
MDPFMFLVYKMLKGLSIIEEEGVPRGQWQDSKDFLAQAGGGSDVEYYWVTGQK